MPLLQTEDKTSLEELKCKLRTNEIAEVKLSVRAVESSIDSVVSQGCCLHSTCDPIPTSPAGRRVRR